MNLSNNTYKTAIDSNLIPKEDAIVNCKSDIDNCFYIESFTDFYNVIDNLYTDFNFKDTLTDEERIAEYKYIHEQYLKYIFSRQDKIINKDNNYKKMYDILIDYRKRTGDSAPKTRKEIVYQKLRNMWLDNIINLVDELNYCIDKFKEEGYE